MSVPTRDITEATAHGDVYLRRLRRAQLGLALVSLVAFTAGYLALLLFVAAPLRRFGSYTIPDFAEARLGAPGMRLLAALIVLLVGGCYLVPQLKGAGVTLGTVTGAPYWVGVAVVALIVTLNVGSAACAASPTCRRSSTGSRSSRSRCRRSC